MFVIRSHPSCLTKLSYLIIILRSVIILGQLNTRLKSNFNITVAYIVVHNQQPSIIRLPQSFIFMVPIISFERPCSSLRLQCTHRLSDHDAFFSFFFYSSDHLQQRQTKFHLRLSYWTPHIVDIFTLMFLCPYPLYKCMHSNSKCSCESTNKVILGL